MSNDTLMENKGGDVKLATGDGKHVQFSVPSDMSMLSAICDGTVRVESGCQFNDQDWCIHYADGSNRRWIREWNEVRVWPPNATLKRVYPLWKWSKARAQNTWEMILDVVALIGKGCVAYASPVYHPDADTDGGKYFGWRYKVDDYFGDGSLSFGMKWVTEDEFRTATAEQLRMGQLLYRLEYRDNLRWKQHEATKRVMEYLLEEFVMGATTKKDRHSAFAIHLFDDIVFARCVTNRWGGLEVKFEWPGEIRNVTLLPSPQGSTP